MSDRRLYIAESIMLVAVLISLAAAEASWWICAATPIAVAAGWHTTIRKNRPILGPLGSRIFVVTAFAFLIVEDFLLDTVAVLALSHFMEFVCISKLLQARNIRDHAQMLILLLLLLAVAAIVTGNLLFPMALAVYLVVGLDALIRFNLFLEKTRVEQRSRANGGVGQATITAADPGRSSVRATAILAGTGLVVGVAVFVLCPRFASSLLPTLPQMRGGHVETGFSGNLDLNTLGPITESDRPVMRVVLQSGGKQMPEVLGGPHLRGTVSTQYVHSDAGGGHWEWRRFATDRATRVTPQPLRAETGNEFELLPQLLMDDNPRIITQHYTMEAGGASYLFSMYPAVRLRTDPQVSESIKKWVEDQVLQPQQISRKPLRYTVDSLASTVDGAAAFRTERGENDVEEPRTYPLGELPRAAEFQQLVGQLRANLGSLDLPENRLAFARRIEEYLRPPTFSYTLDPPSARGNEPIGEFLFNHRRGHCVYFASSMAVLCQLAGVPARVVSGFCGGDYNSVGNFYIVRQKHAHSWVEVFIPGQDWVTFDPTPSALALHHSTNLWAPIAKYLDYFHFQWTNLVLSFDAEQRRLLFEEFTAWLMRPVQNEAGFIGGVAAFVRELFGWRLKLTWRERLIYWAFTLLLIALVLLLGYVLFAGSRWLSRRLRARKRGRGRMGPPEAEFYYRFAGQLAGWGIQRRADETPAEFAAVLAERYPVLEQAPDLVNCYYAVAFGGQQLPLARLQSIERYIKELKALEVPPGAREPAG